MTELEKYRDQIDALDEQLIALFEERMNVARGVGEYKKERGLPILNAEREAIVIEKNVARVKDESLKEVAKVFLQTMMDLSKEVQKHLMED
ncbi:hypothetical protein AOC36_10205 [Erysipelothrix larvae]|uniref:Chorismate mutase domain-containing protein n=1 Tax=Erysipelothrix larvae TaxID=1514105 RepID=A0A0X8H1G1_9FIRM|nr:chorismate mutase [Erysipelothrix larvae]AMC94330.1 hypothetical protein AOC36_10205 [Erysipelothrix larvae]